MVITAFGKCIRQFKRYQHIFDAYRSSEFINIISSHEIALVTIFQRINKLFSLQREPRTIFKQVWLDWSEDP